MPVNTNAADIALGN